MGTADRNASPWKRRALRLATLLGLCWLAVAAALFIFQRSLIYPARAPRAVQVAEGMELVRYPAGEFEGAALWVPPPDEATVVVYFHANGPQLAGLVRVARSYGAAGVGFLAVEYPGYGVLAEHSPSETSLLAAAEGAMAWLKSQGVAAERVVLQGRSLGTGVAVAMAARGHGVRLALVSPFTSVAAVGAKRYWFLPVRWLVLDPWDSAAAAPKVTIDTLVVHGDRDRIVPYSQGVELTKLLPAGRLVTIEGAGHNDIFYANDGAARRLVIDFCRGASGAGTPQ